MTANTKRVVFTMGGKGGVGKTGVMVALAEWFEANQIPVTLLDLDTENKARGSLQHFFNGRVTKVAKPTPGTSSAGCNICVPESVQACSERSGHSLLFCAEERAESGKTVCTRLHKPSVQTKMSKVK